jgi:hypothetical protein
MQLSEEQNLIRSLNSPDCRQRLQALSQLKALRAAGPAEGTSVQRDVNNHIHTHYSFSPYSPAKAVWMAARAGLVTAGIMDHDTIAGAREFIEAGRIIGLPTTIGAECRVSFADTPWPDAGSTTRTRIPLPMWPCTASPTARSTRLRLFSVPSWKPGPAQPPDDRSSQQAARTGGYRAGL